MTPKEICTYHPPSDEQIAKITSIRNSAVLMIETILANAPASADRTAAIRKVREALMTANAAVVLNGASVVA